MDKRRIEIEYPMKPPREGKPPDIRMERAPDAAQPRPDPTREPPGASGEDF